MLAGVRFAVSTDVVREVMSETVSRRCCLVCPVRSARVSCPGLRFERSHASPVFYNYTPAACTHLAQSGCTWCIQSAWPGHGNCVTGPGEQCFQAMRKAASPRQMQGPEGARCVPNHPNRSRAGTRRNGTAQKRERKEEEGKCVEMCMETMKRYCPCRLLYESSSETAVPFKATWRMYCIHTVERTLASGSERGR